MKNFLKTLSLAAIFIALAGCGREEVQTGRTSGFEDFIPQYNRYIKSWLEENRAGTLEAVRKAELGMQAAVGEEREAIEKQLINLKREQEKWEFRLGLGDYFRFGDPSEIPGDLVWEDGMEHEEIGDPRAKKGGTFRNFIPTFPPTLRPFGDNSNNGFRSSLYDDIDMKLVDLHPKSM